jgi:hypothetical protein
MSIGGVSLNTSQKKEPSAPPGPPFPADSADNGLSVDVTGKIVFGNEFGDPAAPAKLLDSRELDCNGNIICFDLFGSFALPNNEHVFIGVDPFSTVSGVEVQSNYTAFPPGANTYVGFAINAVEFATLQAWIRGVNNDSYVFGTLFSFGGGIVPLQRINFFDTGNTTFVTEMGIYPESQDIDTGINWFFNGNIGMSVLNAPGANPVTSVGWDTVTGELLSNENAIFNSVLAEDVSGDQVLLLTMPEPAGGALIKIFANTVDWSDSASLFTLKNITSDFQIFGLNDPGLGGDFVQINFQANAMMTLLLSGNFLFSNSSSGALSDSGSLAQFFGDVDVNGNLNVSTGATGTFTTVDLKTVTVTNGIVTAIV